METSVIQPPSSESSGSVRVRPASRATSPEFIHPSPELPAWFSKCMKLLVSPTDEAKDELGRMFEEVCDRKDRVEGSSSASTSLPAVKKPDSAKPPPQSRLAIIAARNASNKAKAAQASSTNQIENPAKKLKTLDSPKLLEPRSGSPEIGQSSVDSNHVESYSSSSRNGHFGSSSGSSAGSSSGETLEIGETTDLSYLLAVGSVNCTICGSFNQTSGNTLLECTDCHKTFHQLCHKPPVIDIDPNNPRFLWYCDTCLKRSKKIAERNAERTTDPAAVAKDAFQPVAAKPKPPYAAAAAAMKAPSPSEAAPLFKRVQPLASASMTAKSASAAAPVLGSGVGLGGLAKLASGIQSVKNDKPDAKRMKYIDAPARMKPGKP